ncbi:REP-associated tyrosine transposase [Marinigracilibium pacificum]|uniref:Transposase n=1 Tax=Marinigracilibium pacificum TaxID=2729599 RepID=A0A848IVH4_9BACT|nr:transposase [Marinigracilibium pacificum]NMM48337.1 transposase [Marinigracilibium pacificum]
MSEKYKFNNPEGIYFVTCTVVFWIDLFTRKEYKHIILDTLEYYQRKRGLNIHAYCIMPSHIHMIISSGNKDSSLAAIMRDFKKLSNKRIITEIGRINESRSEWLLRAFEKAGSKLKRITSNKIWIDGNHPIELDSNLIMEQKLDYIHNNPVDSEIVDEPEKYWYSSARDYFGDKKGLIDVKLLK